MAEPACKRTRHHSWDNGPQPGSVCLACKTPYKGRGRRALGDDAQAFAAALGGQTQKGPEPSGGGPPTTNPQPTTAAEGAPPSPPPSSAALSVEDTDGDEDFWPMVADGVTGGYVWINQKIADRARYRLNKPSAKQAEKFSAALARKLAKWFPDVELSETKKLILAGVGLTGSMWIGAEKLPPEKKPETVNGTNGAPRAEAITTAPPSPSASAPSLELVT